MPKTVLHPITTEDDGGRSARITGSDIMAAWLGVLLLVATVLTTIFFR